MSPREKIIDRIKKLLELSQSSNENEAALAAARAAELMLEHQLSEGDIDDDVDEPEPVTEECIDDSDKTKVTWKINLLDGLADSLGCFCYYTSGSRGWSDVAGGSRRYHAHYKVAGPQSGIDTVRYMYAYLVAEVKRLADVCYKAEVAECRASDVEPPSARAWKGSFRVGCARMIARRLREQRQTTLHKAKEDGRSTALMVIDRQAAAVTSYVKREHPGMRTSTSYAGMRSRSGLAAGAAAGKSVSLGGQGRGALGAGSRRLKS